MLKELPRARLANLPTPLHAAKHLSKVMGGPRILFKRDDAIGLILGGQKVRMMEYELGDAIAKGCDVIVTTGSEHGNQISQMVACANKLGMDIVVVLYKSIQKELTGNALLLNLLDPVIIETEFQFTMEDVDKAGRKIDEIVDELRRQGRHPYKLYPYKLYFESGVYQPLGVPGYFYCVQEIMQQLKEMGETAQYIYMAHGCGLTHGGLVLGTKYFHAPFKVVGTLTLPGDRKADRMIATAKVASAGAKLLNADITIEPSEIILHDEYLGEYGATKESIEAIRLVAKTEGIFLDPHYTGKTMAALLDDIRCGKLTANDTVIFYHSGGVPLIFYYPKELQVENSSIEALYR